MENELVVSEQPLVLRDNLLTPDYHSRRGSTGRLATPVANHGIETSLRGVTHLFIKQAVITAEFFVNAPNRYEILNSSGDRVYLAAETTDLCTRILYGGCQPFHLTVCNSRPIISIDASREQSKRFLEVLTFSGKPGVCAGPGNILVTDGLKPVGSVQQLEKYGCPLYSVRTPEEVEILQIRGPDLGRCCFGMTPFLKQVEFEIVEPNSDTMVGKIAKQWGGYARELFTKADIWGIKFPPSMHETTKALLLAAVFLIDFQYFER